MEERCCQAITHARLLPCSVSGIPANRPKTGANGRGSTKLCGSCPQKWRCWKWSWWRFEKLEEIYWPSSGYYDTIWKEIMEPRWWLHTTEEQARQEGEGDFERWRDLHWAYDIQLSFVLEIDQFRLACVRILQNVLVHHDLSRICLPFAEFKAAATWWIFSWPIPPDWTSFFLISPLISKAN